MRISEFKKDVAPEKNVSLSFRRVMNGVEVIAVDDDGERVFGGSLLKFKDDGTIVLFTCVNPSIGFQLDESNGNTIRVERSF